MARDERSMNLVRSMRVLWGLFPVIVAVCLATPSVTLPGNTLGIRRFQTPPLSADLRLGQTFAMTGQGLHAIDVFPVQVGPVRGDVRFELYQVVEGESFLVQSLEVFAEDVVAASPYRFEFAPLSDSMDRVYRLDLVAAPAEGVAFLATHGERYAGGALHANGRERWADLAFRVYAPTPSIWGTLMALRRTNPVRAFVVIGALAALWLGLGAALRTFDAVPPAPESTGASRAA